MNTPIIHIESGAVKGKICTTDIGQKYYAFQHIPYAKKLCGEYRFKDPLPVERWNEILDATQEGAAPYQFNTFSETGPQWVADDNCLGINVYTPEIKPIKQLPVFVWIYGGGFNVGSSSTFLYGPDYIVEQNVIMVSFNYRVNIFGFLSFKDPSIGVPGNAGLKDQVLALKWIKRNIQHFGGDPNNITLAGESAGSASVHYHLISDMSKNLFNRAICLSGSVYNPWAQAPINYYEYIKKLAILLGLNGNEDESIIFKKICECDPIRLLKHSMKIILTKDRVLGSVLVLPFLPQVEPYITETCFLPKPYSEMSKNAWSKNIDVIIGGCANEGLLFYKELGDEKLMSYLNKNLDLLLLPELQSKLTKENGQKAGKIIKELYYKSEDITTKNLDKRVEYLGDKNFWYGIYKHILDRKMYAIGGKTYVYYLNIPTSKDKPEFYELLRMAFGVPHMKGTGHGEDLVYLFKTKLSDRFKPEDDNYGAWQKFLAFVVNFSKYADPKDESINWKPLCGKENKVKCLIMTQTDWNMHLLPNLEHLETWNTVHESSMKQAKY